MTEFRIPSDLLGALSDACPMGIFVVRLDDPNDDRTLRIMYANRAVEKHTGVQVSDMVGKRSEDAFPALREQKFIDRFLRVLRTGQPEIYEDTYYADERVAASFSGYIARIPEDSLAIWFENTTARKQTEIEAARALALEQESSERAALVAELSAANQRAQDALDTYEMVASAAEEALWEIAIANVDEPLTVDATCHFSDRFAEIVGCAPSEIEHKIRTFRRFVHPEDAERVRDAFWQLYREPSTRLRIEYRLVTTSGEIRHVQGNARARADAHGRPRKLAGVIRDVTEQKQAEIELRERLALIEQQRSLIEELSTPLLEIWEDVIALPIVGALDGQRAEATMQELLSAISERGVRFALVDLTGVETIDAGTAEHVVRIAQAIALLGARAIVTGIQPPVAQTIVELGLELSALETRSNLRDGLRECLEIVARERSLARRGRRAR